MENLVTIVVASVVMGAVRCCLDSPSGLRHLFLQLQSAGGWQLSAEFLFRNGFCCDCIGSTSSLCLILCSLPHIGKSECVPSERPAHKSQTQNLFPREPNLIQAFRLKHKQTNKTLVCLLGQYNWLKVRNLS